MLSYNILPNKPKLLRAFTGLDEGEFIDHSKTSWVMGVCKMWW